MNGNRVNSQPRGTVGDKRKGSGKLFQMKKLTGDDDAHVVTGTSLANNVPSFVYLFPGQPIVLFPRFML